MADGISDGINEGFSEGLNEGINKGLIKQVSKEVKDKLYRMLLSLYQNEGVQTADTAKHLNVSIQNRGKVYSYFKENRSIGI